MLSVCRLTGRGFSRIYKDLLSWRQDLRPVRLSAGPLRDGPRCRRAWKATDWSTSTSLAFARLPVAPSA
jgi:hypothetical protein